MKYFLTAGNDTLKLCEGHDDDKNGVKVKISKIMPALSDIHMYHGTIKATRPTIPCHMATAIISEDRPDLALKRGQKALLSPYASRGDDYGYSSAQRYGIEVDGFLRNFATLPADTIIPLPDDIKENQAVFAEYIATAIAVANKIKLKKGDYVVVIGSTVLANLVCQLVMYYQAIPILVDRDDGRLELAEDCGVYYTINEQNEDVHSRVLQITGGRLADACVLHARAYSYPNFLFSLAGEGANCIIASLAGYYPRLDADISQIVRKSLKVHGITSGADDIEAAVNLLLQRVLKLDKLVDKIVPFEESPKLFSELTKDTYTYFCPIIEI